MDAYETVISLGGTWSGREGRARCPACDSKSETLAITPGIKKPVVLYCFKCTQEMPVLEQAVKSVTGGEFTAMDAAKLRRWREEKDQEVRRKAKQALRIWQTSQPIHGTVAETYLRSRGITCDLPEELRFHPALNYRRGEKYPAMVARFMRADAMGVHRTYLKPDGSGKADVESPKKMLGPSMGGAIQLLRNGSNTLLVAEGIENGLSLLCGNITAGHFDDVWVAGSAGHMAAMELPERLYEGPLLPLETQRLLVIAADPGKAGEDAAADLKDRAEAEQWLVEVIPPPQAVTGQELDYNDLLRERLGG